MAETIVRRDVHTERIFVTAELARRWLKLNMENNRPINQERINMYQRDMKAGRWRENGDTIKFADTGELIDGQHRLTACATGGVGFFGLVAYGIQRDAFLTIDRNQTRTTGQLLHLVGGVGDYNVVAGALTWLWRFRDGIMLNTRTPTSSEAAELLALHPKLVESVSTVRGIAKRFRVGSVSAIIAVHYIFSRQEPALAELFFEALGSGTGLRPVDPVYHLREVLIRSAQNTRRIGTHELIALYFKAWLAEREQRTVKLLKWSSAETFPNIGPLEPKADKKPAKARAAIAAV